MNFEKSLFLIFSKRFITWSFIFLPILFAAYSLFPVPEKYKIIVFLPFIIMLHVRMNPVDALENLFPVHSISTSIIIFVPSHLLQQCRLPFILQKDEKRKSAQKMFVSLILNYLMLFHSRTHCRLI